MDLHINLYECMHLYTYECECIYQYMAWNVCMKVRTHVYIHTYMQTLYSTKSDVSNGSIEVKSSCCV